MKAYLVGGAVRDTLLNLPVRERDWVVIGETAESMIARGYTEVGKDFPVFLHPETKDEYALARIERKTTRGYKGFAVHATPDVSMTDDLMRRDLTINAMALMDNGEIFDPYGGQEDLKNRIFRHISPAFCEDPVRVLRIARFCARYQHLGFSIAPKTQQLMREMVTQGEIDYLVPERVWAETAKALSEQSPAAFFQALRDCDALARIFPELDKLFGVPQPASYHPEIDTGVHTLMVLDQAALLSGKTTVRFAALMHDLGKALTPADKWPSHHGHETLGLKGLCQRLRVPNHYQKLALQVMQYHTHCHRAFELKPATLCDTLASIGAFKADNQLDDFLLACEADAKGRLGLEETPYPQAEYILAAQQAAKRIDSSAILDKSLKGKEIGLAIHRLRTHEISKVKKQFTQNL
ncbi:multifunctional CCA tRNA nucleotidyl transferase/2'3'-cyclic phosphodiesterase/2'nucleotidase/phosphatase [Methylococcaceae bacterium CS1]|uniref:multifunctional CCA addition/repair protein n=1 Tax=Bathymodiolus platifrons methanotrophic gill symbiont TaxID=113268 RepID=UPI000B413849|nr:multifunctional CCA addition/repair protein [Bathymodiolus platifrons methanotrophic gill symbiont]MCK5870234.1 multifunctional CCA addition/repair protein [Methyloprofundus sp.]TXK98040.1 multifunctional CCA tRNA nucleotidyl transferase/2'3'-cyclic phosphodiesterase/2'nucleotidase/phosphatase [Methylococcaceae bacterium CS5]TXK99062.1 multifunctional CCA tRNA nucleotidyl transferase/2'3'-cyclic phosphodiesterase/2'nucleotidase/phosphatase [Methylococcaceae bacterium CS4]TXL08548.1 multifunc